MRHTEQNEIWNKPNKKKGKGNIKWEEYKEKYALGKGS